MKTLEESLKILKINSKEEATIETENYIGIMSELASSQFFMSYVINVFMALDQNPISQSSEDFMLSFGATIFVAGLRVGQEMEKGEFSK